MDADQHLMTGMAVHIKKDFIQDALQTSCLVIAHNECSGRAIALSHPKTSISIQKTSSLHWKCKLRNLSGQQNSVFYSVEMFWEQGDVPETV